MNRLGSQKFFSGDVPSGLIYLAFFTSGFAALLYQLVWQRALFNVYGTNIESVTVIVTTFMLGLGIGSLLGGELSKRTKGGLLLTFAFAEIGIGGFGLFSLKLIASVGSLTLGWTLTMTGLASFGLLLLPTTLMGATLPLLVAHAVDRSPNVGRAVGALYFVNTLGAALASFAGVLVLFGWLGQQGTVVLAAALNIALGGSVLLRAWLPSLPR